MQLYFIRHGQSVNNALWAAGAEYDRTEDPELTEQGESQAMRVAEYIQSGDPKIYMPVGNVRSPGFGLTHLYASLMVRAVRTGTYISEATGVPLVAWEDIHECGGIHLQDHTGEYICMPGKTEAYFREHFPNFGLPDVLPEAGWWNNRPVETPDQWRERARKFLGDLKERHGGTDHRVGIVSHGGFYMEFVRAALELPDNGTWLTMYNTALSLFDFKEDGKVELVFHNRVEHLPGVMIT